MAICANCGSEQPDNATICRNCGAPMERPIKLPPEDIPGMLPDRRGNQAVQWLLVGLAISGVVAFVAFVVIWYATYRVSRGMPMEFFVPLVFQHIAGLLSALF